MVSDGVWALVVCVCAVFVCVWLADGSDDDPGDSSFGTGSWLLLYKTAFIGCLVQERGFPCTNLMGCSSEWFSARCLWSNCCCYC